MTTYRNTENETRVMLDTFVWVNLKEDSRFQEEFR